MHSKLVFLLLLQTLLRFASKNIFLVKCSNLQDGQVDASKPTLLAPHSAARDVKKPSTLDILTSLEDGQSHPSLVPATASASVLPPTGSAPPPGSSKESQGGGQERVSHGDGDSSLQQSLEVSV